MCELKKLSTNNLTKADLINKMNIALKEANEDELCRVTYNGFISLMITDDTPCKPFDRQRKGLNLGEGAAVLVLESNKHQQKVQANIYGYGIANDAHHLTAPHPKGRGLKHALIGALKTARINKRKLHLYMPTEPEHRTMIG